MRAISCVVSTHNRETVHETIASLKKQTHPVEIIVIDDASEPPFCTDDKSIRVMRLESCSGLSVCRNHGYRMARGEIVAFIDDDACADIHWAGELEQSFEKEGADIAGGLIVPVWGRKPPWWMREPLFFLIAINIHRRVVLGCNFAIRRGLLEELGTGFLEFFGRKENQLIAGDETYMFAQAAGQGKKMVFNEKAKVRHIVPGRRMTVGYILRRSFWEGRTDIRKQQRWLFECRLRDLVLYPVRILKSTRKKDMFLDFIVELVFRMPYFYGMLYETAIGASDYGKKK